MNAERPRLVVIQLAMGAYRQSFLDVLLSSTSNVRFLVGDQHFMENLITEVTSPLVQSTGRNVFFLGRTFAFQRHVLRSGIKAPQVVLESNPRIITSWILLIIRRLIGRPTYGWGHADSRNGEMSRSRFIRRPMQWLCTGFIAYTPSEQARLQRRFKNKDALVAHNAVYRQADMQCHPDRRPAADLILIGRLVDDKKPGLAVDAFCRAAHALPHGARLHVVGDGSLMSALQARAQREPSAARVVLHGKVNDIGELRDLFSSSCAMLAGGGVGLNVTQSLGFGVPVIYPADERHGPEVEACNDRNSVRYRADDEHGCAAAIVDVVRNAPFWIEAGPHISAEARSRYSTERMIQPFVQIAAR